MANDTKLQYIIELLTQGDTTKAASELGKLDKQSAATGKGLDNVTRSAQQLFGLLGGSALIKQSIEKFIEQERAVNALNAALAQTGQFSQSASQEIQALAEALGDDLKKEADDVLKVMTQLLTFGAKRGDLKRLTESVFDLSEVMGRDVSRAARGMSVALKGNTDIFTQLGIEIDKTKTATEQFNQGFEAMVRMINGRAREALKGVGGEVESLKLQLEQLKETLGGIAGSVILRTAEFGGRLASIFGGSDTKAAAEGATLLKEQYLALGDELRKQLLAKERMGQLDKEETGRLLARVTAAQDLLRYREFTPEGMGLPEVAEMTQNAFGQFQTTVGPVGTALGRTLFPKSASAGKPPAITTPGLEDADMRARADALFRLAEADNKLFEQQQQHTQKLMELEDRRSVQAVESAQNIYNTTRQLQSDALLSTLTGMEKERATLEINHQQRLQQLHEMKIENEEQLEQRHQMIEAEGELYRAEQKRFEETNSSFGKLNASLKQIGQHSKEALASGIVDSLSAVADGSMKAGEAFKKFAADFMKEISKMILKAYALYAIEQLLGLVSGASGGGGGAGTGGQASIGRGASGGQWMAMASGGMAGVSSPTFLPRFNVLAGEAGPEILTVLSRPKFESIQGVPAQVGMAGRHRLAITSADALARGGGGGAGGTMHLRVTMQDGLKAEIVENSISGAVIHVTQEMQEDTNLSRATRRLVS